MIIVRGRSKRCSTVHAFRGRGVASRILEYMLEEARARGYRRLSLETGSMAAFAPARVASAIALAATAPASASAWAAAAAASSASA